MIKKSAADSTQGKLAIKLAETKEYDIPEGLEKLTKAEKIVWNRYTRARTDWKEVEFCTLHRIVKMETGLKKLVAESKKTPPIYEKHNGDMAPHPIHAEMRNALKMFHTELKIVGLQVDSRRSGTIGQDGVKAKTSSRGKKPPTGRAGVSLVG